MRRSALLVIALLMTAATVEAKGPTVKLTVTGPGLARPIEITDSALLDGSNVWGGAFIGDTMAAAPTVKAPRYTVAFDVKLPEWHRAGIKTMYAVSVARDASTGALWLYLPGRGEPGYALNVGTMLRDTQDGHWHRPPPQWASALAKYLP
ncbi:MAG TPA: hypothetical protein VIY56_00830 [Vicinamibacterales bacterium]